VGSKRFVVVGAGLGGLATALRLAHLGHSVTVLERTDQVGGRNRVVEVGDCTFDAGPTLVMMLDPFRKLFADVGERIEDHLELTLCDPSYRVFYADGERIEGTTNVARMTSQIEAMAGAKDAQAYPRLLRDLAALYEVAIPGFVRKNFYRPGDFFGLSALVQVARHGMLSVLTDRMGRYFDDPRVQMLFTFQSMYLGLSPYRAPWVYAVLTYMEYGEGIWYPRGGVAEIGRAVARLAEQRGAEIRLDSPVARFAGQSVVLESGEVIEADAVICNADLPYAKQSLTNSRRTKDPKYSYSCSAFMMYVDYAGALPGLLHHNVFFGAEFKRNLDEIFTLHRVPGDPAFYACVSARTDRDKAAEGHENLFVLVPCPNLDHPWSDADAEKLREHVFARLAKEVGFEPERVAGIKTFSPRDWASELNLAKGAAFGLSHEFRQSAYFRAPNWSDADPHVYYVGASTVPGNGLPMVLISAELVEDRLRHNGLI